MKRFIKTLFCIGCGILISSCGKSANDIPLKNVEDHRKYQTEKLNKGKSKELIAEYKEILNRNAKSSEALYLLARITDNKNEAEKLIDKSLNINSNFYYALLSEGDLFEEKLDYEKAEGFYKKAIKINSKLYHAHCRLGSLYLDLVKNVNKNYSNRDKVELLKKVKSEYGKCSEDWEHDKNFYVNQIDKINNAINTFKKCIEIEELKKKLCDRDEHEAFLRNRFEELGKSIYQINLMSNYNCRYAWYVLVYNEYGSISTCQVVTSPNYQTGEIQVTSSDCY